MISKTKNIVICVRMTQVCRPCYRYINNREGHNNHMYMIYFGNVYSRQFIGLLLIQLRACPYFMIIADKMNNY